MRSGCKYPGCPTEKIKARGYCNAHYIRDVKGQDMSVPVRAKTDEGRFWQKVDKSGPCWIWTGATQNGYGVFRFQGGARLAHRVSYSWRYGEIPDGVEIDHMCWNRSCINPGHLRPATKILNGQNRTGLNKNNKSGYRGVYWANEAGCWIAKGHKDGVPVEVGRFDDVHVAAAAISAWRKEHMPYSIYDKKRKEAA